MRSLRSITSLRHKYESFGMYINTFMILVRMIDRPKSQLGKMLTASTTIYSSSHVAFYSRLAKPQKLYVSNYVKARINYLYCFYG